MNWRIIPFCGGSLKGQLLYVDLDEGMVKHRRCALAAHPEYGVYDELYTIKIIGGTPIACYIGKMDIGPKNEKEMKRDLIPGVSVPSRRRGHKRVEKEANLRFA